MDFHYAFVYIAVNVFCILMAVLFLSKLSYNMGNDRVVHVFRLMVLCFLGFVVCELVWSLIHGGFIDLPLYVASVFKVLSTLFIPLQVYFWFVFAEMRFGTSSAEKRLFRILWFIPVAILFVFYIVSIPTGIVFSFAPDGDLVPGPAIGLTGLVDNIYGISIIVHAIILAAREKFAYRRRVYFVQVMFIVICTAGGIIDAAVENTPVMPLAIALSFTFLTTNLQESQIYNDALTGLNNRRRADRYLEDSIDEVGSQGPFYLFMIDIDNFKTINDTRGHLEGDKALQAAANAIATAAGGLGGFVSRWGGDEFMVLVRQEDGRKVEEFEQALRESIAAATGDYNLDYSLSVSIGYSLCTSSDQRMTDLISEADKMLYQNKRVGKLADAA